MLESRAPIRFSLRKGAVIAVAAVVMLLSASAAAFVVSGLSDQESGALAPPVGASHAPESPAETPAERIAQLARECETAPLIALSPAGTPTMKIMDLATREMAEVDVREACRQRAPLTPDPAGDLNAEFFFENGVWRARYYELTRENVVRDGSMGQVITASPTPIPDDEAQQRLAEQKSATGR
jgi:hypothetical protein